MSNKKKIEGRCPHCGAINSVRFVDFYYNKAKRPYAIDVPVCRKCEN